MSNVVVNLDTKRNEKLKLRKELLEKQRKARMLTVGEVENLLFPLQNAVMSLLQLANVMNINLEALKMKGLLTEEDLQKAKEAIIKQQSVLQPEGDR